LIDDISGLKPELYLALRNWVKTFEGKYPCVGKVVGSFYDVEGKPVSETFKMYEEGLIAGNKFEVEQKEEEKRFPGCNSMFTPETGSSVWCSLKR
jgi:hypothetical protein